MVAKKKPATKPAKGKASPDDKQLATKPNAGALSANAINLEEDASAGQEAMGREDFAIPRLTILQDLSKQVKKTETEYIKGAEAGHICDVLNQVTFDGEKGILVIPVSYRRAYIEWRPRESGGGFVKDHGNDASILDKCTANPKSPKIRNITPDGNQITTTAEYFVFLVTEDGTYIPYVLSMAGSQLKKARRWNTMVNQLRIQKEGGGTFNPAMFYRAYRLTTKPERNDQGSWFGWEIRPEKNTLDLPEGGQIYLAARDLRNQIAEGKVTASAPHEEHGPSEPEGEDTPM